MKKFFLFGLSLFLSVSVFSENYKFFSEKTNPEKKIDEKVVEIYYNPSSDIYFYNYAFDNAKVSYKVSIESIEIFHSAFGKFLEWNKIAEENKIKFSKMLPISVDNIEVTGTISLMDNKEDLSAICTIIFEFISLDGENCLKMTTGNKVQSYSYTNKFDYKEKFVYELPDLIMDKTLVEKLYSDTSAESLNKLHSIYPRKADLDKMFN